MTVEELRVGLEIMPDKAIVRFGQLPIHSIKYYSYSVGLDFTMGSVNLS